MKQLVSTQPPATCPYWSPSSKACLLIRDGLFLPVDQHVDTYCRTSQHTACQHYQQLVKPDAPFPPEPQPCSNYRRSTRILSRKLFRFSELGLTAYASSPQEEETHTIDVSKHGVRFTTYRLLTPQALLSVILQPGDLTPPIKATGKVIWSKQIENSTLFQSGLAFTEQIILPEALNAE